LIYSLLKKGGEALPAIHRYTDAVVELGKSAIRFIVSVC